ncbi:MAG: hypothetical protein R6X02_32490 [Enhygromyxa sp.]
MSTDREAVAGGAPRIFARSFDAQASTVPSNSLAEIGERDEAVATATEALIQPRSEQPHANLARTELDEELGRACAAVVSHDANEAGVGPKSRLEALVAGHPPPPEGRADKLETRIVRWRRNDDVLALTDAFPHQLEFADAWAQSWAQQPVSPHATLCDDLDDLVDRRGIEQLNCFAELVRVAAASQTSQREPTGGTLPQRRPDPRARAGDR